MNPLIGKKVTAVFLAPDGVAIKFDVEGLGSIIAYAEGDCCSTSWIETVETPENLLGIVSAVEDLDFPEKAKDDDYNYIQFYGCKISTEKGSSTLDYRNESNGFYGGYLHWDDAVRNIDPIEDWKKIA